MGGGDLAFHALDKQTGKDLWSVPALETTGTPMTYEVDGRQFVAVATVRGEDATLLAFTTKSTKGSEEHEDEI